MGSNQSGTSNLLALINGDKVIEFKNMDKFLEIVNQSPPDSWLQNHPLVKNVKYLPIERVEWMLDKMFQQWRVEVLREGTMFNSIYCAVRLHYYHPVQGAWTSQDGYAAVPAKTKQGAKASDMTEILSESVMTGLPAAKSFAIKDAADHIGKIFGRDVNRKNQLEFIGSYSGTGENGLKIADTKEKISKAKSKDEFASIMASLSGEQLREVTPLINARIKELKDGSGTKD